MNWVAEEGHTAKNQCRNPGGIFESPVCISSEKERGIIR